MKGKQVLPYLLPKWLPKTPKQQKGIKQISKTFFSPCRVLLVLWKAVLHSRKARLYGSLLSPEKKIYIFSFCKRWPGGFSSSLKINWNGKCEVCEDRQTCWQGAQLATAPGEAECSKSMQNRNNSLTFVSRVYFLHRNCSLISSIRFLHIPLNLPSGQNF